MALIDKGRRAEPGDQKRLNPHSHVWKRQEKLITLFILSIIAYGVELIGLPRTRVGKFNVNIEPGPRMSQPLLAVFSIEGFSLFFFNGSRKSHLIREPDLGFYVTCRRLDHSKNIPQKKDRAIHSNRPGLHYACTTEPSCSVYTLLHPTMNYQQGCRL